MIDNSIVNIVRNIHKLFETTPEINFYNYIKYTNDGFMPWEFTNQGLIIKYSYGIISDLITPYGQLRLRGSCGCNGYKTEQIFHNKIMSLFNLELYKELVETDLGCYGPYYKVVSFNGVILPTPTLVYQNDNLSYDNMKLKYKQLFN